MGKLFGISRASRGGFGAAEVSVPGGRLVAFAAVNAFGDVVAPDGGILAGARSASGEFADTARILREGDLSDSPLSAGHTTLVCVVTDVPFEPSALRRVTIEAQDGIARAVRPAHTAVDGDVVFAMAPRGPAPALSERLRLGEAAAEATSQAIRRAVTR